MIPLTLVNNDASNLSDSLSKISNLPAAENVQLHQLYAALLSICSMVLLGFADDVLGKLFKKYLKSHLP